ncbi:MAG: DUF5916 domain-containing protein [Gemmatimonadales bacterium]
MARSTRWLRATSAFALVALVAPGIALAQGTSAGRATPPATTAPGHSFPSPLVRAARAQALVVDGKLDEAAWAGVAPATDFRQAEPREGEPASQRTEVRILFDDEALYIGARMFDTLGAEGVRRQLVRRDQNADSDWLELIFDTYHNHLGRTVFAVNPSGVRQDAGQATEFADQSWDPVWRAATQIDSLGWTAELRIPFSQLRFSRDSLQTWGMQVWRTVSRINEISMWSFWGRNEAGGPSRFGHVEGIQPGRGATRRLELLPYVVSQFNSLKPSGDNNPFYRERYTQARFGGDLKYLLTSNLTLDATINPDFGQVEVDPAVVNLSAFETFFPERRPFFVEGSGTFGFGGFSCYFCSNVSSLSMFYSRRIGRTPQGSLPSGTQYADVPDATTILGAAKITGRTASGLTLGVLNAVTNSEEAPVIVNGAETEQQVEPLTNYFVGRVRQDFSRGDLVVGAIGTSVYRSIDDPLVGQRMARHAEAVGVDWNRRWKNRTYSFMGNLALANVSGDPAVIRRMQTSSARYFQRPDRQSGGNGFLSDRYDPDATRIRGMGGYSRLAKDAGEWIWEASLNWRTPGFENNELAFNTRADYIWGNFNLARSLQRPTRLYRNYFLVAGSQRQYNFDGDRTDWQMHAGAFGQLLNYWQLNFFVIRRTENYDDALLRGGPVVRTPGFWFFNSFVATDTRKQASFNVQPQLTVRDEGPASIAVNTGVTLRPSSNVNLSVGPSYRWQTSVVQYVKTVPDSTATAFYGNRYVLSDLRQSTLSFDTRLNVTFTPALTLELFAQPFMSAVHYKDFKEYDAPRRATRLVYGRDVGTITSDQNAEGQVTRYRVDPDAAGPAAEFTIDNPDFNFRSLRGNAVLRWEYRPGSTLYLVWTRNGSAFAPYVGDFDFSRDFDSLLEAKSDNVFLLKASFWLNR